jgi:recombination associated protein RdgC
VGDVPDDVPGTSLKRIRAQAFVPLVPEEDTAERHGWASADDPFDLELDHEKIFFNEYVTLTIRIDRWAIPSSLLKASIRDAEEKALAKRGAERLGRQAKAEIKDMVIKKLRKQLVPSTKAVDLVWNLRTNVVLFFSHSKKMHELAGELFEKTFKLRLWLESPGTAADRSGLDAAAERAFHELVPTTLASDGASLGTTVEKELLS